ncbi:MAG: hypothetical protein IJW52_02385 [Clostridia bacterium]|nr:hypothetical protein [Clostridia bacterium]
MNDENKNIEFENNTDATNETREQLAPEVPVSDTPSTDAELSEGEPTIVSVRPRGIGKTFLKVLIALLSFLVVFSLVASASYAALSNYVLFPDFDDALVNSLENKFDLGTEFDFASLSEAGKIELEMYPSDEEAEESDIDKVIASISYKGLEEASMKLIVGDEVANAYINEDAIAANIENFKDGAYYGIALEDIVDRLEGSFFDPEEESDYVQLTDEQFDELVDTLETIVEMKESEREYKKDAALLLETVKKAFKDSSLSEHDVSYGGIKIFGEERSARCKRYDFDLDDIADFLEKLADEFDDPSQSLEDAVENLFDNDSSPLASLVNGYDCDDIVDEIDSLVDEIDSLDEEVDFTVILAYSANAFTAIQIKAEVEDVMSLIATIDFGESPTKDKGIIVNVDVTDVAHNNGKMNIKLVTALEESDGKSEATMTLSVDLPEQKNEIVFSAEFDKEDEKAVFSARTRNVIKEGTEELTTESGEEELFKFSFDMLDTKSKFSLTVDELIASDGKAEGVDGNIILSFYKKPDRTRMPRFEDVVDMKVRSFDRLCDDLSDYLDDLGEEYESFFDIDISGVIPEIDIPGVHPQPDDDGMGIIGGEGNSNNNNNSLLNSIADGDYFYIDADAGYSENYRFSGDRYYFTVYDSEAEEYLWKESGTYYMNGSQNIVFCPEGNEEYEAFIRIYADRIIMFDMVYEKT